MPDPVKAARAKQALYSTARNTTLEPVKEGAGIVDAGAFISALVGSGPTPRPPAYHPNLPRYTRTQVRGMRVSEIREHVLTGKDTDSSPLVEIGHLKPKGT